MTDEEEAAIDEFYRIKATIENGERFDDTSTPLHALLSVMSACKARDGEAVRRVHLSGDKIAKGNPDFDSFYSWLFEMDILRAPLPPKELKDGDRWLVYITDRGSCGLDDGLIFVYAKGKWKMGGNMGNPVGALRWRRSRSK